MRGGPYDTVVEYDVTVSEKDIVKDTLYINGVEFGVNDYSADPKGEDYEEEFEFHPNDVADGQATIKIEVEDDEGGKFSDQITVTIDVDLLYRVRGDEEEETERDHILIEWWNGLGWDDLDESEPSCNTTGNSLEYHSDVARYCTNGDTPPMTYYTSSTAPSPGTFEMGSVQTWGGGGSGNWTHTDQSAGHDSQTGTVTYCINSSGSNMGHYFIVVPNGSCGTSLSTPTPTPCQRVGLGIHGGGPSGWTLNEQMATDQGTPSTHGCIRLDNGCKMCKTRSGYLYWLGEKHKYWRGKSHPIFIYVPPFEEEE